LLSRLHIGELRDVSSFEKLIPEWNDLWRRSSNATTFQRPEWLIAYMQVFHPQQPWGIEVRDGEQLVGLAILQIERKARNRVVAPIGLGISDYLDVLIDATAPNAVLEAVLNHLAEHRGDWDLIHF
jgi:CelD/BcsL family acetyltransferase involved in cellulose biosynthesis